MPAVQPITSSALARLDREIKDPRTHLLDTGSGSVQLVENRDPLLRHLGPYRDERAYVIMEESYPKLYDAWTHRISALLSEQTELQVARAGSPAAALLHEYGVQVLKRIPRWRDVLELMLDARKWGWRPMQILVDPEGRFRGQQAWFPRKIVDKQPQYFRFTTDGRLAHVEQWTGRVEVFPELAQRIGWLPCASGSIDHPYGTAIYRKIWFWWYSATRFYKKFAQGLGRSMGLMKVHRSKGSNPVARVNAKQDISAVVAEVEEMRQFLDDQNVLIELDGWQVELISDIAMADGWLAALEYIDKAILTAIVGETLTTDIGDRGSFAAAQTHAKVRKDYAIADATFLEECVDDLVSRFIGVQFGEVDPDDMPRFFSRAKAHVDLDATRAFFDMGGRIDARQLAQLAGVPAFFDEGETDVILEKAAGMELLSGLLGARPPDDEDEEDDDDDKKPRAAARGATHYFEGDLLPQVQREAQRSSDAALRERVGALLDAQTGADPKG